jgi:hypothetical protein
MFTRKQARFIIKSKRVAVKVGKGVKKVAMSPNTIGSTAALGLGFHLMRRHEEKASKRR